MKLPRFSLWKVSLADGQESEVLPAMAGLALNYAPGKKGIYFIKPVGEWAGQELAFFRFATKRVKEILSFSQPVVTGLTISPDEQLLLYSRADQVGSDLRLIENLPDRSSHLHSFFKRVQ